MLFRFFLFLIYVYKSSFNIQYSYRHRTISGNWKTLKNHEKYFLFHLNKLNMLLANQILHTYYAFSLNQMFDIRGRWTKKLQTFSRHFFWEQPSKYCIGKFTAIFVCMLLSWSRRYSMNWTKCLIFVVGGPKSFKLLVDIFFENSLQNTVLGSLLLFLCACY